MTAPASVLLGGTGAMAAAIQVVPATLSFVETGVGSTSAPTTITVTNSGITTALGNLALAAPAGFQLTNNSCPATLAVGASCTADVAFAPANAGQQGGNLVVSSSTLPSAANVPLSGMGFDFTVAASGSSSQSVASGQTADYTLALTPLGGSLGTFAFQCGTLPANAFCMFNPNGETVGAGGIGNVTVEISTGTSSASSYWMGPGHGKVFPLVCGLVVIGIGCQRLKGLRRIALLVALMIGISSCTSSGGGSGGSGGGSGVGATPPGTYSIPVTVTSIGVQHSLTLTLVVD
jgi:hypothetical protein